MIGFSTRDKRYCKNTTAAPAKATFNDLPALKAIINGHDFWKMRPEIPKDNRDTSKSAFGNQNAHQSIYHLHKSFEKIYGLYETCSRTFEDFLLALDALSNTRLTHQIINPGTYITVQYTCHGHAVNVDMYLANSSEYTQVHIQYL